MADMKEKQKQYTRYLQKQIAARPVCAAALILVAAMAVALKLQGPDRVQQTEIMLRSAGLADKESITAEAVVDDIRSRNSEQGISYTVVLTDVYYKGSDITAGGKRVLLYTDDVSCLEIGECIKLTGKVSFFKQATNHGEFDSAGYYINRGYLFAIREGKALMYGGNRDELRQGLYLMRCRIAGVLEEGFGQEDAAILKAMLLGVKEDLNSEIKQSFQKNGIAHILAISGLHISFLCMSLYKVLIRIGLPVWAGVTGSELFLVLYVMLVGFSPSAVRAAVMFSMFLIAKILKRSYDMLTAVSVAAIVIGLVNPGYIYDASFKLSFMAILGVGFFYKNMADNSHGLKKTLKMQPSGTLKGIIHNIMVKAAGGGMVSFFVTMSTMPIILGSYYEIAFYSVLLNILIVPLMSVLLVAAIAYILMTVTVNPLGAIPALAVKAILAFYKLVCAALEGTGLGRRNLGAPSASAVIAFYAILIFICLYRGRCRSAVIAGGVVICMALMCIRVYSTPRLHMLDVGQGDCFVYFGKNKAVYMFDGGSSSDRNIAQKKIIPFLKYYGVNSIDGIFLSHPDEDHINGIGQLLEKAATECIYVKNIYVFNGSLDTGQYEELADIADRAGCKLYGIEAGFCLDNANTKLVCLFPEKGDMAQESNDNSLVMKLSYGDFDFLEMGDLECDGERRLVSRYKTDIMSTKVLKVGHHGSSSSSSKEFIEAVAPAVALISAGKDNRYGHPHRETIETLRDIDCLMFRTDQSGEIMMTIRGGGEYTDVEEFVRGGP